MIPAPLINIIVLLLIVAVALYVIKAIPGDDTIKNLVRVLIIAVVAIYVIMQVASLLSSGGYHLVR